jgi:hypothetical protein
MRNLIVLSMLLLAVLGLVVISGCSRTRVVIENGPVYSPPPPPPPSPPQSGPPPWAPAHGHRAKYRYYYYPVSYVYFDVGRSLYFYYRDAGWRVSASLPSSIVIDVADYAVLEMDTDTPYRYHSDVVQHYPPGQSKKSGKGQGQGRGKGNKD